MEEQIQLEIENHVLKALNKDLNNLVLLPEVHILSIIQPNKSAKDYKVIFTIRLLIKDEFNNIYNIFISEYNYNKILDSINSTQEHTVKQRVKDHILNSFDKWVTCEKTDLFSAKDAYNIAETFNKMKNIRLC